MEWYRMVGEVYLQRTDLGVSSETTQTEIDTYHKYEQEGIVCKIFITNFAKWIKNFLFLYAKML